MAMRASRLLLLIGPPVSSRYSAHARRLARDPLIGMNIDGRWPDGSRSIADNAANISVVWNLEGLLPEGRQKCDRAKISGLHRDPSPLPSAAAFSNPTRQDPDREAVTTCDSAGNKKSIASAATPPRASHADNQPP